MRCKSRSGRALLVILMGCALVSVAVGVGVGFFVSRRAQAAEARPAKGKHAAGSPEKPPETMYPLPEMIVNVGESGGLRYAKIGVAVGYEDKIPPESLKDEEPILRDAVIDALAATRFEDLRRRGGVQKLKDEMRDLISQRLPKRNVAGVFFESFAVQ